MKTVKYILAVIIIMAALGGIFTGDFLTGLFFLILGIILLPPISEKLKDNIKLWENKAVRYASYFVLIILAGSFIDRSELENNLDNASNKVQEPNSENLENKVKYINLDKVYYDGNMKKVEPDENDITYRVIEVLKHDKNKGRIETANNEVISLLVETSSHNKQDLKKISQQLKKEYAQFAPDNCFIDLWDDKKAYETYLSREEYISQSFNKLMEEFQRTRVPIGDKHNELKKKWDKKNYPFIADHNIASLDFGGLFSYFPLQDDYYKEVGGKNYKK